MSAKILIHPTLINKELQNLDSLIRDVFGIEEEAKYKEFRENFLTDLKISFQLPVELPTKAPNGDKPEGAL